MSLYRATAPHDLCRTNDAGPEFTTYRRPWPGGPLMRTPIESGYLTPCEGALDHLAQTAPREVLPVAPPLKPETPEARAVREAFTALKTQQAKLAKRKAKR